MNTTADFVLSPMSGACQFSEVLLYTIVGKTEMDGFTVYYHWKHGNGWFYCILSSETWKWMVLL